MPLPDYLASFQHLRLNEVVIPGSHDAGIYTANRSNVQTQSIDITDQAIAGCRFFDMRIATHKSKVAGRTVYTHKAFHLDPKLVVNRNVKKTPGISSYQNVGHAGGWGGSLRDMLGQAREFVEANGTEFLVLKFSKCSNWASIAQECLAVLEGVHYETQCNINTQLVGDLRGKVITAFDESALPELAPVKARHHRYDGIQLIRALYDKETGRSSGYEPGFNGVQYFGKFSSTDDIDQNTKKQASTLAGGAATHRDALGMMYWTTTGLLGNINHRNAKMWTQTNVAALQQTWTSGLSAAIGAQLGGEKEQALRVAETSRGAIGVRLKAFMPNIVMMDFVDDIKCRIVRDLNDVAASALEPLMLGESQ